MVVQMLARRTTLGTERPDEDMHHKVVAKPAARVTGQWVGFKVGCLLQNHLSLWGANSFSCMLVAARHGSRCLPPQGGATHRRALIGAGTFSLICNRSTQKRASCYKYSEPGETGVEAAAQSRL
eukprot:TRINITY_DN97225_c0_g1_i1.p2 TRINITY_DN97225_c0_g1~~TRINITY_DN97225_c0_g1_i1.p2  ORF type:complete len:124 (+),score=5.89 TRINITY_DN97225_c0_g1_i1:76-447(+)